MNLTIALIIIGIYFLLSRKKEIPDSILKAEIKTVVNGLCNKYNFPYNNVVNAIILVESSGDPTLIGKAGERGLMQISKVALDDVNQNFKTNFKVSEMYDSIPNIACGILFLKLQLNRCEGNVDKAIRSYNAGFVGAIKYNRGFDYLEKVKEYL